MSSPDDNANLEMAMAGRFDDCPGAPQYEVLQPARRQGRSVTASLAALSHEQSTLTTTRSWGSSKSRHSLSSLSRKRSQNGFGVDDFDCRCDEGSSRSEESPKDEEDGEAGRAVREKGPFEVGWVGGDNDPLNPRSFHIVRKWTIVLIVSLASICVTCCSSIYASTYTQMDAEFGSSRIVSTLGLSAFVAGIAVGPMLLAPLSEFYGRRPVYLVSFVMFVLWIVPSAVARNIWTMIVGRFFDGLAGSAFLSVAGGTVGDVFAQRELHLPMTIYSAAPFVGPSLGPLLGGFINSWADWRWTYYVMIIWSGALLLAIFFFVPETYHPVILRNRARKLRKETGDDRYKAPIEKANKSLRRALGYSLLRPFQLLLFEVMVLLLCIYSAILLGVLYLFFGAFPLIFTNNHSFTLWQVGLSFFGIFVGNVLGSCTDPVWHRVRSRLIERNRNPETGEGVSEPEYRLPPAIVGGLLVPIGLFWFGWTTYPSVHWIVPLIGSAVFGTGLLLVFSGIFTFLVDAYPLYAASALAANAFVRCASAAAFPLFGDQMYTKLGYQWATSLLAFLTVAMMPFPYLFFRYGKRFRSRSRYATEM